MKFVNCLNAVLLASLPLIASAQTETLKSENVPAAQATVGAAKSEIQPSSTAQESSPDEKQICENLKKTLQAKLGIPVDSVTPTPIKGLFEAVAQNEIMYSDATAEHLIVGQLFETKTQRNLTAETKDRLSRIDFSKLPLKDAIKVVNGTGAREIAVFSDPNCSFCRKLEQDLKNMKDVTIYVFLYPVIRPSSIPESQNIWCAKDPAAAWRARMLEGKMAPEKSPNCDTKVIERNIALGSRLGISGTPTVFVPSGQRAPGAVSMDYLEKLLTSDTERNSRNESGKQ